MSTISKQRGAVSVRLGAEIRQRRRAIGLSQANLGWPLTRAFVSAVEHGRCLPSLGVLALFADRLDVSPAELLDSVKHDLAALYTRNHAKGRNQVPRP